MLILVLQLWTLWKLAKIFPKIYLSGRRVTKEELSHQPEPGVIRVQNDSPRGSILMPKDDLEEERERIIQNRKAQGLDTPVDMLRDNSDHEE